MPENTIYVLTCEDASHLGGPMGTEYTTLIFNKHFLSLDAARDYPKKYQKDLPKDIKWDIHHKGKPDEYYSMDSGAYIWTIKKVKIED